MNELTKLENKFDLLYSLSVSFKIKGSIKGINICPRDRFNLLSIAAKVLTHGLSCISEGEERKFRIAELISSNSMCPDRIKFFLMQAYYFHRCNTFESYTIISCRVCLIRSNPGASNSFLFLLIPKVVSRGLSVFL